MSKVKDLTGQNFGRLLVVESGGRNKQGRALWKCKCECGNDTLIRTDVLTRGLSNSCGCLAREITKTRFTNHGKTVNGNKNGNQTYVSWKCMKQRCCDPNTDQYQDYGGRGISVCDRWVNSFENFLSDMGERPVGTTIDRINVNGDYAPGNCRWATLSTQNKNKRKDNTRKALGGASKYKGVSRHGRKWQTACTVRGKKKYLGAFDTEIQAAIAYDKFAKENCGDRAWLNSNHYVECVRC